MDKLLQTPDDYQRVLAYIEKRHVPVNWYSLRNLMLHDDDRTPIINPNVVLRQLYDEGYLTTEGEKYVLSGKGTSFLSGEGVQ